MDQPKNMRREAEQQFYELPQYYQDDIRNSVEDLLWDHIVQPGKIPGLHEYKEMVTMIATMVISNYLSALSVQKSMNGHLAEQLWSAPCPLEPGCTEKTRFSQHSGEPEDPLFETRWECSKHGNFTILGKIDLKKIHKKAAEEAKDEDA